MTFRFRPPESVRKRDPAVERLAAILATLEPPFRRAVLRALERLRGSVSLRTLAEAIESGSIAQVESVIDFASLGAGLSEDLTPAVRQALLRGGEDALSALPSALGVSFALDTPRERRWLANHGADLVREIDLNTRQGLRAVLSRMFRAEEPIGSRRAARQVREILGLTERQSLAVTNFRRALEEARAGERTMAQVARDYALSRDVRMPAVGLTRDRIDRMASDYAARWRTHRANVVAEHEAMVAYSEGERQMWSQAAEAGALDPESDALIWDTAEDERVCERCLPMDDQVTRIGGMFVTGLGEEVRGPAHIGCRCGRRVIFAEDLTDAQRASLGFGVPAFTA